jgi:ABC-type Mn2+/Zn2+ transport system permease subunit
VLFNMAPAAVALQQQRVHWLPASWTVGIMSAFLGITSFVAVNVPESYMVMMVLAEVTQPVSIIVRFTDTYSSQQPASN